MTNNDVEKVIWLIIIFGFLMVTIVLVNIWDANGDELDGELLEGCYEQLKESTQLIEDLFEENQSLKAKVKELEKEIETLKFQDNSELLDEAYNQLQESNELISLLKSQNDGLRYLNKKLEEEVKSLKYRWLFGGALSYPVGGEFMFGYGWKNFGLYSNIGLLQQEPFINVGVYFKK